MTADVQQPEMYEQFPQRYDLCRARVIDGDLVSYCPERVRDDGLCHHHKQMRANSPDHVWDGYDLDFLKYKEHWRTR